MCEKERYCLLKKGLKYFCWRLKMSLYDSFRFIWICYGATANLNSLLFQCGDRPQTLQSDVYRRQILTSKDDPRAVIVVLVDYISRLNYCGWNGFFNIKICKCLVSNSTHLKLFIVGHNFKLVNFVLMWRYKAWKYEWLENKINNDFWRQSRVMLWQANTFFREYCNHVTSKYTATILNNM